MEAPGVIENIDEHHIFTTRALHFEFFATSSQHIQLSLKQQFFSYKMTPNDNIAQHISMIQSIALSIADVGEAISNVNDGPKESRKVPPQLRRIPNKEVGISRKDRYRANTSLDEPWLICNPLEMESNPENVNTSSSKEGKDFIVESLRLSEEEEFNNPTVESCGPHSFGRYIELQDDNFKDKSVKERERCETSSHVANEERQTLLTLARADNPQFHCQLINQHQHNATVINVMIPCEVCDEKFSCITSLKKHKTSVHGEKYYKCEHCGYRTGWQANYIKHLKVHSGVRPYRTFLTLMKKYEIIQEVDEKNITKTEIAQRHVHKKDHNIKAKAKNLKGVTHVNLERTMLEWFSQHGAQNLPINRPMLQSKADEFALRLDIENFKGSSVRLERFKLEGRETGGNRELLPTCPLCPTSRQRGCRLCASRRCQRRGPCLPTAITRPCNEETWQRLAPDCTYEEYIAADDDITVWGTLGAADIIKEQQESSKEEGGGINGRRA
uniref:Uncharacterized protein n=1 Tax=Timema shepardi TaxID=629360 RepID=A0A7R9FZH8_TIMSH|nr:unnamed protein product [Timema shepardi]